MYLVISNLKKYWTKKENNISLNNSLKLKLNIQDDFNYSLEDDTSDNLLPKKFQNNVYKEIYKYYNQSLRILVPRLNSLHNTNYSENYWKSLIGFWLLDYITYLYNYFYRISAIRNKYKNIKVQQGELNPESIIINDYNQFLEIAGEDDEFNQLILSQICKHMNISVNTIDKKPDCIRNKNEQIKKTTTKNIFGSLYDLCEKIFSYRARIIIYVADFPKYYYLFFPIFSKGRIAYVRSKRMIAGNFKANIKNNLIRIQISKNDEKYDNFSNILISLLSICMPIAFLEDYNEVRNHAEQKFKSIKPKVIFSPNSWWSDHAFTHWACALRENGITTVSGLHSPPAIFNSHRNFFENEVSNTDYFINWSKDDNFKNNILTAPSNKLIKANRNRNKEKNLVLFLTTIKPFFQYRSLEDFSIYIEEQISFLQEISTDIFKNLEVRLNKEDFGWDLKNILIRNIPKIKFNDQLSSFYEQILNAKVCVYGYFGTTAFETIALNIPTIIFINEECNEIVSIDKKYNQYHINGDMYDDIQVLKRIGIIHTNPKSAIQWLEKHYDNIDDWWREENCQQIVTYFVNKYFYNSENSFNEWNNVLGYILKIHLKNHEK